MKKKLIILSVLVILVLAAWIKVQSSKGMKDGYYTAEMAEFHHGWKEYLCIQVKKGKIVSAEYNARNASGFIKAWDNSYMKNMIHEEGIYPNKYTRDYVQQLIEGQANTKVDAISGATSSGNNFKKLVKEVLHQAEKGDANTRIVN